MKIMFFGLGSVGEKHLRLLKEKGEHELYAYRTGQIKGKHGIKEITDLSEIDKIKPNAAFITNPTFKHVETAIMCAEKGMNIFMEKPLSHTANGLEELKSALKKNNSRFYIAYCMRFHPVIKWMKNYLTEKSKRGVNPLHIRVSCSSYLPDWRPGQDHLETYSAHKSKGGGVILDLSHEIDYLMYLFGDVESLLGNSGKASNVTRDAEDYVDVLFKFKSGAVCNLHSNFFSHLNRREIIVDFEDHTVTGDLNRGKITALADDEETVDLGYERDKMFREQLDYFLSQTQQKAGKNMNDFDESLKVFEIVMKVKEETRK